MLRRGFTETPWLGACLALVLASLSSCGGAAPSSTAKSDNSDRGPPSPQDLGTVCPIEIISSAAQAPARWDLHGAFGGVDVLSPVHDQMKRGDCWIFAEVSQLETEYIATYGTRHTAAETEAFGARFNLSEQYLMDMFYLTVSEPLFVDGFWNNTPGHHPTMSGTVTTANFTTLNPTCGGAPMLGLPSLEDWPTARTDATVIQSMMQSVPLVSGTGTTYFRADDTYDFSTLLTLPDISPPTARLNTQEVNGLSLQFNLDLANFYFSNIPGTIDPARSVYPPASVHEDARYAPLKWFSLQIYNANAEPAEVLPSACSQRHIWDYPIVTPSSAPVADQAACYAALAAPYEATLSQNHPIVFATNPEAWNFDPFPLTRFDPPIPGRSYWTGGCDSSTTMLLDCGDATASKPDSCEGPYPLPDSGGHTALLIGYDRERQLFHLKNSWGTAWGTGQGQSGTGAADGTAWMTYDLFFRTVVAASHIDGVWDPTGALATEKPVPAPIPTGAWFGFWQASLRGSSGVAVIGHFPANTSAYDVNSGVFYGQPGSPVGTFYPSDRGTPTDFRLTSWGTQATTYWADFGDMQTPSRPLFRLSKTFGSALPRATFTDLTSAEGATATWSKCIEGAGSGIEVLPTSYVDALSDPYVLPPCDGSKWHVEPTWTCPSGGDFVDEVQYTENSIPTTGQEYEVTRLCLITSGVPVCRSRSNDVESGAAALHEDVDPVTENYAVEPDQYGKLVEGSVDMPKLVDVCVSVSDSACLTRGDCALPTCSTHGPVGPATKQPLLGANPWVWVQPGADDCITSTYAPTATCPPRYALSPNGTDCLAQSAL